METSFCSLTFNLKKEVVNEKTRFDRWLAGSRQESTITRKLASLLGASILDLDDIKRKVVNPDLVRTQIDPPEVRWTYYEKALEHAFSLKTEIVMMDEVFHLSSLRARLEEACTALGAKVGWIEVRCSYEVVERRLRAKTRVGHILSTDEALRMYQLFQEIFERFPGGKENHIVVDNNDD